MTEAKKKEASTSAPKPWRMLIYAEAGWGKSTLASKAPGEYIIDLDDGLGRLDVKKSEDVIMDYDAFMQELRTCYTAKGVKTVVVDTISLVDEMIEAKVLKDNNVKRLNDLPWGQGFKEVESHWRNLIKVAKHISKEKNVLFICHSTSSTIDDPMNGSYTKIVPELSKKALPMVCASMDIIGYGMFKFQTIADSKSSKPNARRAVGGADRIIKFDGTPQYIAKSRFDLPAEMNINDDLFGALK